MPDRVELGTASNHYISEYYHLANRCGLDGDAMLIEAGIPLDIVDQPDRRVSAEKLAAVLLRMWEALQDETTSLSKYPIPRGSFLMVGKLTVHEPNLGRVFSLVKQFYGFVTRAFDIDVAVEGDKVTFSCTMRTPEMDEKHLFAEINLMSWHRYSSWLVAENIPLSEVYFSYPEPHHVAEYAYLFPGKHVFNAPYMGFSFHKKYLERECVQSAATLKTFMSECPILLFLQPRTDFSTTSLVQRTIKKLWIDEIPTIDKVANYLHLTERTLSRKLKDEGTSFQKIKDVIRLDRAINYLLHNTLTISGVAEKVGFSDPAVFARAFKSWTGVSPTEYRRIHLTPNT